MSRRLNDILKEADSIIEKRAGVKKEPVSAEKRDEEVVKLAELLMRDMPDVEKPVQDGDAPAEQMQETPFEKVAHAIAIIETAESLEQLTKIAKFEEQARANGYTDAQIEEFIEKKAMRPVHKYVKMLGAMGAAGGVGAGLGYHKGKQKGQAQAVKQINKAFEEYGSDQ